MSTEENFAAEDTTDLDAFSAELFGDSKPVETPAKEPEADEPEKSEDDATDEKPDTQDEADDTLAEKEDDDPEDEESEEVPEEEQPKPKPKSRYQERIDELTRVAKEAERREQATTAKFEQLLARLEQNAPPEAKPQAAVENTAPAPDDTLEDGSDKYPLGEFDPQYIVDLTKHTLEAERKTWEAENAKAREQATLEAAKNELVQSWEQKLEPARERYPDFQEKAAELVDGFNGIDQQYGEYLTQTIMGLDYGTDVLYHLANNPDEAKAIVASGPLKATLALGKIEAKFALAEAEKTVARPKVSKAPTPPPTNKGSAVARGEVLDTTDDLDAFAAKFFSRKG